MDKIDSFVIYGKQIDNEDLDFTFVINEADIKHPETNSFLDEIEYLVHKLNKKIPQFKFTWGVAHKTKEVNIYEEIIHQILIQSRFN